MCVCGEELHWGIRRAEAPEVMHGSVRVLYEYSSTVTMFMMRRGAYGCEFFRRRLGQVFWVEEKVGWLAGKVSRRMASRMRVISKVTWVYYCATTDKDSISA